MFMNKVLLSLLMLFLSFSATASLFDQDVSRYQVNTANGYSQASLNVFLKRIESLKTGFLSSIKPIVANNNLVIEFKGFAPQPEALRYFAEQPGRLVARIHNVSKAIIDTNDIDNSQANLVNGRAHIDIQLSQPAGERFKQVTSANLGKRLIITLDNKVILSSVLTQPIGRFFRLGAENMQQAEYQAVLLRHGILMESLQLTELD